MRLRADIDENLADNENGERRFVDRVVKVVVCAIFAESIGDSEQAGAQGVHANKLERFISAARVRKSLGEREESVLCLPCVEDGRDGVSDGEENGGGGIRSVDV